MWPMAAIVVVIAVAGALVWAVWRSPQRNRPVHVRGVRCRGHRAGGKSGRLPDQGQASPVIRAGAGPLNELADSLCREQSRSSGLERPWNGGCCSRNRFRCSWQRSSRPLAGPVSVAVESRQFPPLPGLSPAVPRAAPEGGHLQDLHAVYGGLGSGRLVIIGEPGSGKNWRGRAACAGGPRSTGERVPSQNRQLVPVPVIFTSARVGPQHSAGRGLASRHGFRETYPLFGGQGGKAEATELMKAGQDGGDIWTGSMRSRRSCGRSRCGR